jgi:RHS repeat-associated protein
MTESASPENREADFASHETAEALHAAAMVTACEQAPRVSAQQAVASRRPQFQGPPEPAPHDSDGNMTHGPLPITPGANRLDWDAENRLLQVRAANNTTVITTTFYDAQFRRIATMAGTGGATTHYLYDGWNRIAEYTYADSQYTLAKTFLWGLDLTETPQGAGGVGGLLCQVDSGSNTRHYPAYDLNGNVIAYFDSTGQPAAHFQYDPFGNLTVDWESNAADFPYRFSTKPQDPITGLYYYTYRYYDPVTGRWPSRDPIEERGGVNLYGFVWNDGVNWIDLLGLIVATQEDNEYKNKILACFACCGEFEWVKDAEKTIQRAPRKIDTFDKKETWYILRFKGDKNLKDEKVCEPIRDAINDNKLYYFSKKTKNLKTEEEYEDLTNAGGWYTGDVRGVFLSDKANITIPVQELDANNQPVTRNGEPVYVDKPQDFCSILWHEFAGHSVSGEGGHPEHSWNDYEEVKDGNPIGEGKSDPSVEIENQYRKLRGWPLRRPQYYDKQNPRP